MDVASYYVAWAKTRLCFDMAFQSKLFLVYAYYRIYNLGEIRESVKKIKL